MRKAVDPTTWWKRRLGAAIVTLLAAPALALMTAPAAAEDASAEDIKEGFRVSQTCAGCHGPAGAAPGNTIPVIGGQHAKYIGDALRDYRADKRDYYVMNYIAKAFSDDQINQISAWFAAQDWVATETAHNEASASMAAPRAERLCALCHGPTGEGTDIGPRIAGQPAAYLASALQAYKAGKRTSDTALAMTLVQKIADGELDALAHYYSSLR